MYDLIDELIHQIYETDVFKDYILANQQLNKEDIKSLLEKHQYLQEEYLRLKQYESYVSIDEIKDKLKDIKKEMMNNQIIQDYYQKYYELNDLLDELCQIIFNNISDEIILKRY